MPQGTGTYVPYVEEKTVMWTLNYLFCTRLFEKFSSCCDPTVNNDESVIYRAMSVVPLMKHISVTEMILLMSVASMTAVMTLKLLDTSWSVMSMLGLMTVMSVVVYDGVNHCD